MIGSLQDLALKSLTDHLPILCDMVREKLPTRLKEVVLQRLSDRDLITKENIPVIDKCLFVPELKHVNLILRPEVTDEVIEGLADTACQLRSLRIGHVNRLPYNKATLMWAKAERESLLKRLLEKQSELEVLEIKFIDMESCNFLLEIKSRNLVEFMILFNMPMLNGSFTKGMESVAQNTGGLKYLTIKSLSSKRDIKLGTLEKWNETVINIVKYIGANLKVFVIDSKAGLHEDTFGYIARCCPNLISIIVQCGFIWSTSPYQSHAFHNSSTMLPFKENCQQLQNLVFSATFLHVTEDDPDIFHWPRNMRTLKLMPLFARAPEIATQRSFSISHIPVGLQELCIPIYFFEVKSAQAVFTRLGPRLKNLDFPCLSHGGEPGLDLEQTVMSCIVDHCINLSSLYLCCFHEASLHKLQEMFKDKKRSNMIHRLNLMSNIDIAHYIESNHDPHIKDFKKVKTWLNGIVASCIMLREFATNNSYIDNRLLRSIALNCPQFKKLQIDRCDGEVETSGEDTISDEGILELAVNCPLEELHLLGAPFTRITSNGLLVLGMRCPYLQVLTIFLWDADTLEPTLKRIRQSVLRGIEISHRLQLHGHSCSAFTYYRPLPHFESSRSMLF
ncbi:uncharacterized protein LOC144436506 [Glandiceps talaboti]